MNHFKKIVTVIKLHEKDLERFMEVIKLFEVVFEMEPFPIPASAHLQKLLGKSDFFVFAAIIENKVAGGLTAYVLDQYYARKPIAYIYELAVDSNYQRQGIGTKLIAEMNNYCKEKGFQEVFVQAEKVDDYALDFYRSTKPTGEEQIVHFYYTLDKTKTGLRE